MANDKKQQKQQKQNQGSHNSASSGPVDDNMFDLIKQMHDNHLEVIEKMESMNVNNIDKLMEYVDKVQSKSQALTDMKFENTNNQIFDLNTKVDRLNGVIDDLKRQLKDSVNRTISLTKELETARDEADEIQINVNRPYLVVNNFKPVEGKPDVEAFSEFCNAKMSDVDVSMCKDNIAKLIRIKRSNQASGSATGPSRAETMIVKFKEERHRDILFRNKKKLAKSGTTFTELLPHRRRQLLNKCIQELPFENRSVWTDGGKILVSYERGSNNIVHIKSAEDIEKLKERLFRRQE